MSREEHKPRLRILGQALSACIVFLGWTFGFYLILSAWNYPFELEARESTEWLYVLADRAGVSIYDHARVAFLNMNHGPVDPIWKMLVARIFPFLDCGDTRIIQVDSPCVDIIPLSSYYSFRKKNYSPQSLADLELRDGKFVTNGNLANGIMVSLGDLPIESATLENIGIERLLEFPLVKNEQELSVRLKQLESGIKVGDSLYASSLPALENNTYAIRVVAYRGLDYSRGIDPYFRLYEWDKRNDILVIFRTIRKDESGNYTLIWKELRQKNSPKLKP